MVWGCHYFRHYLLGRDFKIKTDHQPLQWLEKTKATPKLVRWALQMAEYNCVIEYKAGKTLTNADFVSRLYDEKAIKINTMRIKNLLLKEDWLKSVVKRIEKTSNK
jgi:hypothetical protein